MPQDEAQWSGLPSQVLIWAFQEHEESAIDVGLIPLNPQLFRLLMERAQPPVHRAVEKLEAARPIDQGLPTGLVRMLRLARQQQLPEVLAASQTI